MFRNQMPRHEILSEDAVATLDRGWRRIVSEIGIDFTLPEAVDLLRDAGQRVDGSVVRFDPEFVLEQVAKAPSSFVLQARNAGRSVTVGGDHMVFSAVYGPPFVREGDVRREGTMRDFEQLLQLVQLADDLDTAGGVVCEPNDMPLDSRHLDMQLAMATLTDRPYFASVTSAENARD